MSAKLRDQFVRGLMTAREYHEQVRPETETYAESLKWIVNQVHVITEDYKGGKACASSMQLERYLVWFVGMNSLDERGLTCEPHPFVGDYECTVCGYVDGGQVWHVG